VPKVLPINRYFGKLKINALGSELEYANYNGTIKSAGISYLPSSWESAMNWAMFGVDLPYEFQWSITLLNNDLSLSFSTGMTDVVTRADVDHQTPADTFDRTNQVTWRYPATGYITETYNVPSAIFDLLPTASQQEVITVVPPAGHTLVHNSNQISLGGTSYYEYFISPNPSENSCELVVVSNTIWYVEQWSIAQEQWVSVASYFAGQTKITFNWRREANSGGESNLDRPYDRIINASGSIVYVFPIIFIS
jgi:hypothetical protein